MLFSVPVICFLHNIAKGCNIIVVICVNMLCLIFTLYTVLLTEGKYAINMFKLQNINCYMYWSFPPAWEQCVFPLNKKNNNVYYLLCNTVYLSICEANGVSQLKCPHLQITILLVPMNSTPSWGEKSTSLDSGE